MQDQIFFKNSFPWESNKAAMTIIRGREGGVDGGRGSGYNGGQL